MDPERRQRLYLGAAQFIGKRVRERHDSSLHTTFMGYQYDSPIGAAAGMDKNGRYVQGLKWLGFGYVEVGSVTFEARSGNCERPRVFSDRAGAYMVNRLGLPSEGILQVEQNLLRNYDTSTAVNIALPYNSSSWREGVAAELYTRLADLGPRYIAINASCPNHPDGVLSANDVEGIVLSMQAACSVLQHKPRIPVVIKVATNLGQSELHDMVNLCLKHNLGLCIGNGVRRDWDGKPGSWTGKVLKNDAVKSLAKAYLLSNGKLHLISCGGVNSPEDFTVRIRAGARLVQCYTGFVHNGCKLLSRARVTLRDMLTHGRADRIDDLVGSWAEHYV